MSIYKQANEISIALASLLRKISESMTEVEGVPVENRDEYSQFQALLTTAVFLQKDLDDFLDKAMSMGEHDRETPVEVLDFTSEWDSFE